MDGGHLLIKNFAKAMTFETSKAAMMSVVQPVPVNADKKAEGKRSAPADRSVTAVTSNKKQKPNPDRAIRIPDGEFRRRLKAKRCVMCGKARHGTCTEKDPTPFRD